MADTRSFTLIGNFTDNITPALDKINLSLDGVRKNLESLSRVTQPLKNDFKDLATHSRDFQTSLKGQAGELSQITTALKQYRAEMGRLKNTQRKLKFPTIVGGGNGGGGGGGRGGGYGGRGGGYGGYTARDSTYVFGQILGNQLAGVLTGSIVQGFQIGVGLMMRPFEYLQSSIKERIADEQSDIKAAGGYFSIARRQEKPFLKSFQEAMEYTQENNKYMAQLAAALPGNTQQYIEVMKRISDSISRTVTNDPKAAIAFANQLRASGDRIGGAVAPITDMGAKGIRQAITEIGGEVTKKTVLAGLGGGGAAGGVTGAYGLPGLSERLLTQDQVSMGQFRRYAAIFRDPLISEALERFIPKLNASKAGTIERLKVLNQMYDEVLPPEMVRAFQRSTAGIIEAYNTAIFGPETGFLGLGRKMAGLGKKMDDYGRYLDAKGDVTDFENAVDASLSIFDMLRDIFANFGIALQPIAEVLPMLFDPLQEIGRTLTDIRHLSGRILTSFESYRLGLIKMGEKIEDEGKRIKFLSTVGIRATLAAINNAFRGLGIYGYGEQAMQTFKKFGKQIKSENFDPGAMLASFIDIFVNSDASKMLGVQIGKTVSSVLQQISKIIDELLGFAKASGLVEGLKKGFGEKGYAAFANIIRKVFMLLGKLLLEVFKAAPLEFSVLGGVSLLLPAFIGGLSTLVGNKIEWFLNEGLGGIISKVKGKLPGAGTPSIGQGPLQGPKLPFLQRMIGAEESVLGKRLNRTRGFQAVNRFGGAAKVSISNVTGKAAASLAKAGNRVSGFMGKGVRGLGKFGTAATIGVGIFEAISALLRGESLGQALGEGAGPILGTIIGTALLGPLGGVIGGMIGSIDAITGPLGSAFEAIIGTLGTTFEFLGQIGSDILWVINTVFQNIFGLSKNFNLLEWAVNALLSPFRLLHILILGLYEAYLRVKPWKSYEEQTKLNEVYLERLKQAGSLEISYKAGMNAKFLQEKKSELARLQAEGKGTTERATQLGFMIEEITKKIGKTRPEGARSMLNGKPVVWNGREWVPDSTPTALSATTPELINSSITTPKPSEKYGNLKGLLDKYNIKDTEEGIPKLTAIDKNTGKGVTESKANRKVSEATQKNTQTSAKALEDLRVKVSRMDTQTATQNILALLASGNLRVKTSIDTKGFNFNPYRGSPNGLPIPGPSGSNSGGLGSNWFENPFYKGGLGDAISSEMKNKPPGSNLVIANSSETIIPAAGGLGMGSFLAVLSEGFSKVNDQFKAVAKGLQAVDKSGTERHNKMASSIDKSQKETDGRLRQIGQNIAALTTKVSQMGGLGMGLGGGYGSAGVRLAGMLGNFIKATGGAPGSIWEHPWHGGVRGRHSANSYHYSGRAIDIGAYANEQAGVIARIRAFNAKMGIRPTEFLHAGNDPNHQDHVHVAYGWGAGRPAFFSSASAADRWERAMAPREPIISSVRATASEVGGKSLQVNAPITIYQQPGQDPEELATIVVTRLGMAVHSLSNHI